MIMAFASRRRDSHEINFTAPKERCEARFAPLAGNERRAPQGARASLSAEKEIVMRISAIALATLAVAALGFGVQSPARAAAPTPPAASTTPAQAHQAPMTRHRVERVQEALNANGAKLDIDGVWGGKTEAALKRYQQQQGLKVTGHLDHATRQHLHMTG
jgi:hypothetical protein